MGASQSAPGVPKSGASQVVAAALDSNAQPSLATQQAAGLAELDRARAEEQALAFRPPPAPPKKGNLTTILLVGAGLLLLVAVVVIAVLVEKRKKAPPAAGYAAGYAAPPVR